jgi:hypothetical protein
MSLLSGIQPSAQSFLLTESCSSRSMRPTRAKNARMGHPQLFYCAAKGWTTRLKNARMGHSELFVVRCKELANCERIVE